MSDPEITIIVPTYNHEALLSLAVGSIVRQSVFDQCLVIVSDDCSSDNTYELARSLCTPHRNIVVHRNRENLGIMDHYQYLVSRITTPFTAILEGADAWISECKLAAQRHFLECHSAVGMCLSACIADFEATGTQVNHPAWHDGRDRIVG